MLAAHPDGTAARPILIRSEVSMSDLPGYQALRAPVRPVAHQIRSMTGTFVVGPIGAVIGFVTGIVRAGRRSGARHVDR